MTLQELQEIGEEVGFSKEAVARAAASMELVPARAGKVRTLGLPVGVDRVVPLARAPTDWEWERLVARLRSTFNARGQVEVMGRLRQWSNGNLRVSIEPTEAGHQLSLHTHKGSLGPLLSMSAAMLAIAVILVIIGFFDGDIDLAGVLLMAMVGVGVGGAALIRLPGWAATRARQLEEIAETVTGWTALPPSEE